MFDPQGHPLPSLQVVNLVRYGNDAPAVPDALETLALTFDVGSPIVLPDTINAIMTDGSKQPVPVTWDITQDKLTAMEQGGINKYEVTGTAGDMKTTAFITVSAFNYLENYGFENGDLTGWTLTDHGKADQLYAEDKLTDSLTGTWHMHFWSAATDSVNFTLEQEVKNLPSGAYRFSISIMGGDSGTSEIFAYVKINGETVLTAPMQITTYGSWDTGLITGIEYTEGASICVGISVKCQGSGNGAWGKIDDAMLNKDI